MPWQPHNFLIAYEEEEDESSPSFFILRLFCFILSLLSVIFRFFMSVPISVPILVPISVPISMPILVPIQCRFRCQFWF